MNKAPASARMGCALNLEQLRTEPCLNHKATLTGQKERERRLAAQLMRANANPIVKSLMQDQKANAEK